VSSANPRECRTTNKNKLLAEDRPAHDWYRFVLSFPPHLVRTYHSRNKHPHEPFVVRDMHLDARDRHSEEFTVSPLSVVEK
jgi:hypothetical protein